MSGVDRNALRLRTRSNPGTAGVPARMRRSEAKAHRGLSARPRAEAA